MTVVATTAPVTVAAKAPPLTVAAESPSMTVATPTVRTAIDSPRDGWRARNTVGLSVRLGVAVQTQRFTSDVAANLGNYKPTPSALGTGIAFNYARQVSRLFRLTIDASYLFAGATTIRYADTKSLAIQTHAVSAGLAPGLHSDRFGGIDFRARLGMSF